MSASTPFDVLTAIRNALKDSKSFQYVGYYPLDVKKATANIQNVQTSNYATAIIEDGVEQESDENIINGYDNIDYYFTIYFFIIGNKGISLKLLHDYEVIIKGIMATESNFSGIEGGKVIYFLSTDKGTKTDAALNESSMIGYSEGMTGRSINYRINMQVARAGTC